jgi:hypothetical protein
MDIDFTQDYSKGDIVYLVRCFNSVGVQEVVKLKLRTIYDNYMVGCTEKSAVFTIGKDWINNIFSNKNEATAYLKTITKKVYKEKQDTPSQLIDEDEEETDDLDLYIDGEEEEGEDNE